jgi:hypothetical protein
MLVGAGEFKRSSGISCSNTKRRFSVEAIREEQRVAQQVLQWGSIGSWLACRLKRRRSNTD